jgi:probable rRNA maturation factor
MVKKKSKNKNLFNVQVVNHTLEKISISKVSQLSLQIALELMVFDIDIRSRELSIVFVDSVNIQNINFQYRKKNKPTDILSFDGDGAKILGELVLCGEIIKSQAKDHKLSFNEELGYLLIHGVLHLLGYEHEKGGLQAKKMFKLQDQIFNKLRVEWKKK